MATDVFKVSHPWQLSHLGRHHFSDPDITDDEFDHVFRVADALWLHNGDPTMPHAELTAGECSNGFVDVLRVLKYTNLCEIFAQELAKVYLSRRYNTFGKTSDLRFSRNPDWVIGSDHAGATISYEVARRLNAKHDFTERAYKLQHWRRHVIESGETVLQVEELVRTTGTLHQVRNAILEGNPYRVQFVPVALTVVHRSNVYGFGEGPILYLRHYDIATWEPEECPLCAAGSKRLRPKQNWAELTGKQ